jgi:hypothetical protein
LNSYYSFKMSNISPIQGGIKILEFRKCDFTVFPAPSAP